MKEYTIDFRVAKTYEQFYDAIEKGFGFPEWFGRNADALWDLLSGYIEYPAKVYVLGMNKLPKGRDETVRKIKVVFKRTTEYFKEVNEQFIFEYID